MSLKQNKKKLNHIAAGSALLMLPAFLFAQSPEALKELNKKDAAIIEKVPVDNIKESNKIYTDLGKDTDALIPFLAKQLSSTKSGDLETTSRFAINGLTWNVGKNGSDKQKSDLAKQLITALEKQFDGKGRVLIRPSGTEPMVRVMIEGKDQVVIDQEAKKLAALIEEVML